MSIVWFIVNKFKIDYELQLFRLLQPIEAVSTSHAKGGESLI